jgi:hypothetical protein
MTSGAERTHIIALLYRPGVARLHRFGRHETVCGHHLLEMILAKHAALEHFRARIRLPAGRQPVHQFIHAFNPLNLVAGVQEILDFGADDFSEHVGHLLLTIGFALSFSTFFSES